jgi:hypothetical protein
MVFTTTMNDLTFTGETEMKKYTFYIEGLNKQVSVTAETEKKAWFYVWTIMNFDERDAVKSYECVEVE